MLDTCKKFKMGDVGPPSAPPIVLTPQDGWLDSSVPPPNIRWPRASPNIGLASTQRRALAVHFLSGTATLTPAKCKYRES